MQKSFLITIDTEGDNLWDWKDGDSVASENAACIGRFQALCEKYGFKPTYLTNYEMASDDRFADMAKDALSRGKCEIGMHLHAYNNPPFYPLKVAYKNNFPYLIEYPEQIMEEKIKVLNDLLTEKFGIQPRSHRAGRWAINDKYLNLLKKYGYRIDCSVTPGIDWSNTKGATEGSRGTDYGKKPARPYFIAENILELPVTIRTMHRSHVQVKSVKDLARIAKHTVLGQKVWLRPNGKNLREILELIDIEMKSDGDYLMFMLHSSEMMPGGSPTFTNSKEIEVLYSHLEAIFSKASQCCVGKTLCEYADGLNA